MAEPSKDQKIERAHLVRAYEASCRIEYPSPNELKFRESLMIKLGLAFGLRGLRDKYSFVPGSADGRPPGPAAGRK